jgi:hypothetical protein
MARKHTRSFPLFAILGASVFGASALALATPASAEGWRQTPADPSHPYVTVPSQYDPSETISAPVRPTPRGDEVRLPGGDLGPVRLQLLFHPEERDDRFLAPLRRLPPIAVGLLLWSARRQGWRNPIDPGECPLHREEVPPRRRCWPACRGSPCRRPRRLHWLPSDPRAWGSSGRLHQ